MDLSRGLGDVYKRQISTSPTWKLVTSASGVK
jgi:hypothetical protein